MSFDFYEFAKSRFSVRKFLPEPVAKKDIDAMLSAAHIAPTGCNYQPQKILVMNTKESIENLHNCTRSHFGASTAMLVCYDKNECWTRPYDGEKSGFADACIVATHIMLAAHAIGVGVTWVMHFNPDKMREVFSIPENVVPVALLVMGYPAPDAEPGPMHDAFRPLEDNIFYDTF